jgi:hypothetical protein
MIFLNPLLWNLSSLHPDTIGSVDLRVLYTLQSVYQGTFNLTIFYYVIYWRRDWIEEHVGHRTSLNAVLIGPLSKVG